MKPISRLRAIIFSVLFACLSGEVLTGCGKEESAETQTINIQQIDPANQQAFVRQMVNRYLILSNQLQSHYQQFKAADDVDGFILYRNNSWTLDYIEMKTAYEKVFYDHKAYIYRQQLDGLFDYFFGLQKLSVHLKHSLQDKDWQLEQQVMAKLVKNQADVNAYLQ